MITREQLIALSGRAGKIAEQTKGISATIDELIANKEDFAVAKELLDVNRGILEAVHKLNAFNERLARERFNTVL